MGKALKTYIKENGFNLTSNIVGGPDVFFKLLNIKTPMNFLHLFDDLDVVQSEKNPVLTLYRYKPKHNLMTHDRKNRYVYINYDEIWSFLEDPFGLSHSEIQELTKTWLNESYNLRKVTTTTVPNTIVFSIE